MVFDFDIEGMIKKAFDKVIEEMKNRPLPSHDYGATFKDISTREKPDNSSLEAGHWLSIMQHPSIVLIGGRRGSGKSALGYRILEYMRWQGHLYVVALPRKAGRFLPEWIGVIPSLEEVPPNSIVLVDESYSIFHARSSSSHKGKILSNLLNLSRQREQTLIFVTQEGRQLDINIASSANVIIFKNPSILQTEFERKQLSKIVAEAQRMFAAINNRDKSKWSYVYAPERNFNGMIENSLPSFWTPILSKAFADKVPVDEMIIPKNMTREEKVKRAKEMHRQGFSLEQTATILGVSKSTVKNYLDDYPYKK